MKVFEKDFSMGWFFIILGAFYFVIGISNKKDWKKNHKANQWKNLFKAQRNFRLWIIISLGILVLAGIIAFLIIQ